MSKNSREGFLGDGEGITEPYLLSAWTDSVRLSTEAAVAKGCTRIGAVSDDRVKDLRKKIVREGGDTAILTFSTDNMSTILAEVYKCPSPRSAAPKTTPPPPASPPSAKLK
jgi:hypothetical protein